MFSLLGNVIWLLVAGIWIAIGHVVTAIAMAITIIGIPLAIANLKLIPVSLMPLGKQIVPTDSPFVTATVSGGQRRSRECPLNPGTRPWASSSSDRSARRTQNSLPSGSAMTTHVTSGPCPT